MNIHFVGYLASTLVLSTFLTTDMRRLRCVAIMSNIAFLAYGILGGIAPVACLHAVLLPLNAFRLLQLTPAGAALIRDWHAKLAPARA